MQNELHDLVTQRALPSLPRHCLEHINPNLFPQRQVLGEADQEAEHDPGRWQPHAAGCREGLGWCFCVVSDAKIVHC